MNLFIKLSCPSKVMFQPPLYPFLSLPGRNQLPWLLFPSSSFTLDSSSSILRALGTSLGLHVGVECGEGEEAGKRESITLFIALSLEDSPIPKRNS